MSAKDSTTQPFQQIIQFEKEEIWKPVVGWEGWYDVSNIGRVMRVRSAPGTRKGKIIKYRTSGTGHYAMVNLCREGKKRTYKVHTLVMATFVGPYPQGMEINHINTVKTDNRWPENLEYLTPSQNQLHSSRMGIMRRGERHAYAKLTEQQVREIRSAPGIHRVIGERFGIARETVSEIKRLERWKHVV